MNPNDPCVQCIARTLMVELAVEVETAVEVGLPVVALSDEDPVPEPFIRLAQSILFDLAKNGIRVVEPDDVLEQVRDEEAHTVRLVLATGE